eukprot:GHVN01006992.1.p1 GENE.GHVN01006992.1~~GHVN01006992.1.p1  ORF type:complete len:289 (-),score=84.77 GHVN01006992.1:74-940(-)
MGGCDTGTPSIPTASHTGTRLTGMPALRVTLPRDRHIAKVPHVLWPISLLFLVLIAWLALVVTSVGLTINVIADSGAGTLNYVKLGVSVGLGVVAVGCVVVYVVGPVVKVMWFAPAAIDRKPTLCFNRNTKKVEMNKALVVVNPSSGKGQGVEFVKSELVPTLEKADFSVRLVETQSQGDAYEVVREVKASEVDVVIVGGGDGTVLEVVNGMWARSDGHRFHVAVLPCGTSNALFAQYFFETHYYTDFINFTGRDGTEGGEGRERRDGDESKPSSSPSRHSPHSPHSN